MNRGANQTNALSRAIVCCLLGDHTARNSLSDHACATPEFFSLIFITAC